MTLMIRQHGILWPLLIFSGVAGGLIVMGGCDKQFAAVEVTHHTDSAVKFLVQVYEFNLPTDKFVVVRYDQDSNRSTVERELNYSSAMEAFGTNVNISVDGVAYSRALELWNWDQGRHTLLFLRRQKDSYKKVVLDTHLQHLSYELESELCWGADRERLYAVKGFNLLAVDPTTGESKDILTDVSSFVKHPDRDEFWVFDLSGHLTCRNSEGKILKEDRKLHGVITGAGLLGNNTAVFYLRQTEYSKGHLVVLELDNKKSMYGSLDLPQCHFLKRLP